MLDIEIILKQFDLIEKKVDHVVQSRSELQRENERLNNRVEELENLIQEKIKAEKKNEELNNIVREKIDALIGRLEGTTEEKNIDLQNL